MIQLADIKNVLGITESDDDTTIGKILSWVNASIKSYLWDISQGEKTILVKKDSEKIWLMHKNCTSITKINGISVPEGSFQILESDEAYILDFSSYTDSKFPHIVVKYQAGYETIPDNIILAAAQLVGFEFSKELWQVVSSEKMWPRAVEFFGDGKSLEAAQKDFYKTLDFYIPEHLKAW